MNPFCANEEHYHQIVIKNMDGFPNIGKPNAKLRSFVWGHEMDLHDAGRGGGNGSADLLIVDEEGMVWLAEAKFDFTTERGPVVWGSRFRPDKPGQLKRYKTAIEKMDWQDILGYVRKFLRGGEKTKPSIAIPNMIESFVEVLSLWQREIGRVLVKPEDLNDLISARLKQGRYGLMILTDIYDDTYMTCAVDFEHNGPLAYVLGIPTASGMDYEVKWHRPGFGELVIYPKAETSFEGAKNSRLDPSEFESGLISGAGQLWKEILEPGLLKLGGFFRTYSDKSFAVYFQVYGKPCRLILIGWPESDRANVSRNEKMLKSASMRVDVSLKNLYRSAKNNIEITNALMKRLHSLGWRGRSSKGMNTRWGVLDISSAELESNVQGDMIFAPQDGISFHNGRLGDRESLFGLLSALSDLLNEVGAK